MVPKIKTKVVHSQTKSAWNVVGTELGGKYKIARVPYIVSEHKELSEINRSEALKHAEFISFCFSCADEINLLKNYTPKLPKWKDAKKEKPIKAYKDRFGFDDEKNQQKK